MARSAALRRILVEFMVMIVSLVLAALRRIRAENTISGRIYGWFAALGRIRFIIIWHLF